MTPPSTAVADHIPAHRFGPLLAEARLRKGIDLSDIAANSAGRFTVGQLSDIEQGRNTLSERALPILSGLYGVDCGRIVPHRAKLFLDVTGRHLRVGEEVVQLKTADQQHILDRYLALVYMLRDVAPGTEIPLRDHDLAILEASLLERAELIEERLLRSMAANDPALAKMLARFKTKLWVPGAGLLVGAVGLGALVFASASDTSSQDPAAGGGDIAASELVVEAPAAVVVSEAPATSAVEISPNSVGFVDAGTNEAAKPVAHDRVNSLGAAAVGIVGLDIDQTFPGWTIEFRDGVPGYHGMTFAEEKRIEIYVQPNDDAVSLAGIVAHELGHAFDLTYLDDNSRVDWMTERGITTQWWVGNGVNDFAAGQGDFAEAFAAHLTGDLVHADSAGEMTPSHQMLLDQMVSPYLHAS